MGRLSTVLAVAVAFIVALGFAAAPASAAPAEAEEVGTLVVGQRIKSAAAGAAGKCLRNAGYDVLMARCSGQRDQDWNYVHLGNNRYQIQTRVPDAIYRCLHANARAGRVYMTVCAGADVVWTPLNYDGGWHAWFNESRFLCMDVRDGGTSSTVQMWDCNGQPQQKWHVF